MLHQRMAAAHRVAEQLRTTEETIDDTLIELSNLFALLPRERRNANMSPVTGQAAVSHVSRAVSLAGELRQAVIEAHIALHETQREAGLGARMFGTSTEKPAGLLVVEDGELRAA
ncbi:MAG: hypothetical protein ABL882_01505 [Sphingopyxis sp.]